MTDFDTELSSTFNFNSFIRDVEERLPALAGRLLVMDVKDYKVYGISALDLEKVHVDPEKLPRYLGAHSITQKLKKDPDCSSQAYKDPAGINIIFFNDKIDPEVTGIAAERAHRRTLRLLNHEAGHLGIPDGYYFKNDTPEELLGECIADAYALISQRFGTNMECTDKYVSAFARAGSLIFSGDSSHFSAFVMQEVSNCRNAIDFDKLTPEKTASIARNFALTYAPSEERVSELLEAFRPVKELWAEDRDAGLKELIRITLDPKCNYDVFRTGNAWLQTFVTSGVTFKEGKTPTMSREDKKALARKLQQREFHFEHQDKPQRKAAPNEWRKLGLNG